MTTEANALLAEPPEPVVIPDPATPNGDPPADPPADPPPPEPDWRTQAAGGNDDYLKLLSRYGSINGVVKAFHDTKTAISQGKFQKAKPDDGDEKAMAEWRKEQGIPNDATGYKIPDVVTKALTDDDKPVLANFTEFAFSKGARPDVVEIASEWYVTQQAAAAEALLANDTEAKEKAEDTLRKDWIGAEYKGNLNLAKRYLEDSPLGAMGWASMRKPDGTLLGNDPEFMKWASDQGRASFGDAAFVSTESNAAHDNEKAEIENILKTDYNRYYREGWDKKYAAILDKESKRRK